MCALKKNYLCKKLNCFPFIKTQIWIYQSDYGNEQLISRYEYKISSHYAINKLLTVKALLIQNQYTHEYTGSLWKSFIVIM